MRKVEIVETFSRMIEVEANSSEEADAIVRRLYRDEQIVLSADDFLQVEFNPCEK